MTVASHSLLLSRRARRMQRLGHFAGQSFLFLVTAATALAVLLILFFITKDAIPFFRLEGFKEFFSANWYPTASPPAFGALPMFFGSAIVTLGACIVAVPLGIAAAVCLSDVLPFRLRQLVKPLIEILAAIPSVAFGFFALVVFAPLLQESGGEILAYGTWLILGPIAFLAAFLFSDYAGSILTRKYPVGATACRLVLFVITAGILSWGIFILSGNLSELNIITGTNAFNVSIILGIMALPTIVSVSEDALQAVGRELREGSYALGATRAETICRVVLPAAASGICAAVILGVMRAVGETMVVWMASGNAAQIPEPWYNLMEPVRTLTATIAGDMGEADQTTGSARYHVLFAMAFCLLIFSFVANALSEAFVHRARKKLKA